MTGRAPSGQALAVPTTPASAVDGPSGFDPSRKEDLPERLFVAWLEEAENIPIRVANLLEEAAERTATDRAKLENFALENGALRHYAECCDDEIKAWREGRGPEYLAEMAALEAELQAIATEARRAETENTGSVHEGAGPQGIAQNGSEQ